MLMAVNGCEEALIVCLAVPLVKACDLAGDLCDKGAVALIGCLAVPLVKACDLCDTGLFFLAGVLGTGLGAVRRAFESGAAGPLLGCSGLLRWT